jgi:predicted lipid-binding transport protein (Tim44 family)
MSDNFQFGDIVLGLIALFVILRLRAVLGRTDGVNPREGWRQATRESLQEKAFIFHDALFRKNATDKTTPEKPDLSGFSATTAEGLNAIRGADAHFSTTDFLNGARQAFDWVVEAFNKGDREKLRLLLSEERYRHFAAALDERTLRGLRPETTLVSMQESDITEATLVGTRASITVQFTTEQVQVVRDAEGKLVEGDPSITEKVIDVWTFERDVQARDPNWKVVAT